MEVAAGDCEVVLFDFFGTLVHYEPDRRRLGYPDTLGLLQSWGHEFTDELFVAQWDAASAALEARSADTFQEFTMLDAGLAFAATTGLPLSQDRCHELAATFVAEWQRHVRPIVGVTDLIVRLSRSYRLGVVSNTHDTDMVPAMLGSMGVAGFIDVSRPLRRPRLPQATPIDLRRGARAAGQSS